MGAIDIAGRAPHRLFVPKSDQQKPFVWYDYSVRTNDKNPDGHVMFLEQMHFHSLDHLLEQCEWAGWQPVITLPPHYDGVIVVTKMQEPTMGLPSVIVAEIMKIYFTVAIIRV